MVNEIVLYQPNETIQLEVRLQDETVWLNQQQIAVLFGTQRQAITKHLKNIFEGGELERQATCSILERLQKKGNRMVHRNVEIYNLDVMQKNNLIVRLMICSDLADSPASITILFILH